MSGFSPDWLDLREGADHRARDAGLVARLAETLATRRSGRDGPLQIVDLGCGLGSNLRALAAHLPPAQTWRLVDHDPKLLHAARARLLAWADAGEERPDGTLVLEKGAARLAVSLREADLVAGLEPALGPKPDLVTAAALFDLCSEAFLARLADAVVAHGAVFYTALTYDGREDWAPPHAADAQVLAAFLADQRMDKGFGPSAGPEASAALAGLLAQRGYGVAQAESPWRLAAPADASLIRALAEGQAQALAGRVPDATLADWRAARVTAQSVRIGHLDLLASPPV